MLTFHSTVLFVKDITKAVTFYTELLGLTIKDNWGTNVSLENGISLWEVAKDHTIATTLGEESIRGKSNRTELYFEYEDLFGLEEKLLQNDVVFLHKLHEESWGQMTIRFFDPDGHLIEVGEPIPVFLQRFYDKGMSVEQIEQKTTVPVREIRKILEIL